MFERYWRKVSVKYVNVDLIGVRYIVVYDDGLLGSRTKSEILNSEDEVAGFLSGLKYKRVNWINFPDGRTADLEKRIETSRLK